MSNGLPSGERAQSLHENPKIPAKILWSLPEDIRDELARLPEDAQRRFVERFTKHAKSLPMAYLCSLIYCHYGLLGRWAMTGWMLLSLFVASTLGFIWWLMDLVRMPEMVREHNHRVAAETLRRLRVTRADPSPFRHA